MDEQSKEDVTAVCRRCGRRLTLEDLGGGLPGMPYKPIPICNVQENTNV